MSETTEFYIQIPLNEHGLHVFYAEDGLEDIQTYVFSDLETYFLMKLFMRFNKEFDLLIDTYETESLETTHLDRALELTEEFVKENASGQFSAAIERFKEALLLAKQCQMPLIFDF